MELKMKLPNLYRELLNSMDVVENEHGYLVVKFGEETVPLNVTVKRGERLETLPVIIPDEDVINQEEDGLTIKFHPFAESPFMDQSEVLNKLIVLASGRICAVVQGLVANIIHISLDKDNIENYKNSTLNLIKDLPSIQKEAAIEKIISYANRVAKAHTSITGEYPVVRFNVGRRKRTDSDYLRWAELSMPVLDNDAEEQRIFGKKAPSKAAYETVMGAYRAVLGNPEEGIISGFLDGTMTNTAPYFIALLRSYYQVVHHLNGVIRALGKQGDKTYRISEKWTELIEDADKLVKEMNINFEGNVGTSTTDPETARTGVGASNTKPKSIAVELEEEEPVVKATTNFRQENKMKQHPFRKAVNPASSRPAPETTPVQTQPPAQETPVKKPQPRIHFEEPSVSKPAVAGKVLLEEASHEIHLYDSLDQPIYYANGRPYMVEESDIPNDPFLIKADERGNPLYTPEGIPRFERITMAELNTIRHGRPPVHGRQHFPPNDPRTMNYGYGQQYPPNDPRSMTHGQPQQSPYQRRQYQTVQRQPQQQQYRQPRSGYVHR